MGKNSISIQDSKLIMHSGKQPRRRWRKDVLRKRPERCARMKLECEACEVVPIAEDSADQFIQDVCRDAQPCNGPKFFFPVCLCEDDDCCDPNCPVVTLESLNRRMILDQDAATELI